MPLCEQGVLPPPLTNMFKADYMQLSYPELLKKCDTSVPTLKQCESIEERTHGQSACKIWFQQRAAREQLQTSNLLHALTQLKCLILRCYLYATLESSFSLASEKEQSLQHDMYDDRVWKEFMHVYNTPFLAAPNHIGLMLNVNLFNP